MAFSRNHAFVSGVADGGNATLLQPSNWNAALVVSGATAGGIPYCPTATTETTSAGFTYNSSTGQSITSTDGSGQVLALVSAYNTANFAVGGSSISLGKNLSSANLPSTITLTTAGEDTSLSRISAGLLGVGTGAAASFAGSLKAAVYQGMMGTGAGIGNMVSTATVNTTAVATTGAGPDILQTYDLPLNSFSAAGKGVHITVWGTSANTAEAKTIILYFGSTAILTNALTASIAGVWRIEADVYSTGTDAQQYVAQLVTTGTAGVALNDVEQGTSAQDDGAAITIKCTGTIGAPSTAAGLVQEGLTVRFIN